ncbi:hypothetical protein D3C81_1712330 [compost metagenome]
MQQVLCPEGFEFVLALAVSGAWQAGPFLPALLDGIGQPAGLDVVQRAAAGDQVDGDLVLRRGTEIRDAARPAGPVPGVRFDSPGDGRHDLVPARRVAPSPPGHNRDARMLAIALKERTPDVDVVAIVAARHGGRALAVGQHVQEGGHVLTSRQFCGMSEGHFGPPKIQKARASGR